MNARDVNFVFFPKIDYHFEKIDFFDYGIWASLSRCDTGYYETCAFEPPRPLRANSRRPRGGETTHEVFPQVAGVSGSAQRRLLSLPAICEPVK